MEVVTVRRFVNWQSKEGEEGGGQKGDMQGPLGQLDSHENEITTALFVLQVREVVKKSKWKFLMAFAIRGGGLEGVSFAIKLFWKMIF